jgi:hypothetical protein
VRRELFQEKTKSVSGDGSRVISRYSSPSRSDQGNLGERPSTSNDDGTLEAPPSGIRAVVDRGLLLLASSHLGFGWGLMRTARDLFRDLESCP